MAKTLNVNGLMAAVVTPMDADGALVLETIPQIVEHLVRDDLQGLYAVGSTGEGVSLTDDERMKVVEHYHAAVAGRMPLVVQVGHNSMRAAARLAAHAQEIGASAVSATSPGYFKPDSEQDLVDSLVPVVAAAPDLPFYYYHIPRLSGVNLDPMLFTRLAMEQLPTFAGIKYSDMGTLYNLPLLQKVAPALEFLSGSDEGYLQCVAQGYSGAVGSTYNYAAPLYNNVRKALAAGDFVTAQLWQGRALEMIRTMLATCGMASLKAMMRMVGINCGPVRSPLRAAAESQILTLRNSLEEMGWFEWTGRKPEDAV